MKLVEQNIKIIKVFLFFNKKTQDKLQPIRIDKKHKAFQSCLCKNRKKVI